MTRRILLVLALLEAPQLSAQLVRSLPSGVSEFRIEGSFEGQAMEPWRGTIEVHDTVLDGRPAFAATHIVHHLDGVFHLTSAWTKSAGRTVIAYDNGGREPNRCRVSIDSGKATATIRTASDPELSAKPLDVRGDVIADFAAGEWMAAKTLAAGDTLRATVVRCLPQFREGAIVARSFVGVVRSAKRPRVPDAEPETVWVVEGAADYPMSAVIAASDRQLLALTIPEGSVGQQTLVFLGRHSP